MSYRQFMKLLGFRAGQIKIADLRRTQKATARLRLETLEDRHAPSVTPGTIIGTGTTLSGQDTFKVDVAATVDAGAPHFSGSLSFADAKASAQFNATTISSIQINETTPVVGSTTTDGYFIITGYATLNDGTAPYSFSAIGALPFSTVQGSTGGLAFQAIGPGGAFYVSPWSPWDAGENIAMTITAQTPKVFVTASPNPATVGQPVTFTVKVGPGDVSGSVTLADGSNVIGTSDLTNGSATFTTSALTVGSHTITATYGGNSTLGAATGMMTEIIKPLMTPKVYVSASPNPAIVGQPVTFTVRVGGDAANGVSGSVSLTDGTTVIGQGNLDKGQATFTTSTLTVGSHTITASYSGNDRFAPATGMMTETIKPVPMVRPKVSLTSSANPAIVGQPVTFKVTVRAGDDPTTSAVTGSVTLTDGDAVIGTADLVNGQASFTTSSLTVGSHTITAKFAGNATASAATATLTEVIRPVPTPKVYIAPSANPATVGQAVTFKVYVFVGDNTAAGATGAAATGSVTLSDGDAVIGTADLVNGQASFTTSSLTVGSHTITAKYSGNATLPSATGTLIEVIKDVTLVTPKVTISPSANPATVGQPVTFKVTVLAGPDGTANPVAVTGSVTLYDGDTAIGTADLVGGQVSFTTSTLTVGSHTITAKYAGNANFSPATGTLTEVIKDATLVTPKVYISPSANPATVGQPVTFKVTVLAGPDGTANPVAVTGSVTLYDGDTAIGTADLVGGQVSFTTSTLTVGSHTITAKYAGNANFSPATGTLTEVIKDATLVTPNVYISPSANPATVGQPVTFKVYVLSGPVGTANSVAVTGSVTLFDGDKVIGTADLVNGQASFTTSTLTVGSHTIIAKYAGSTAFAPALGTLTETIKPLTTPKVTVVSSANPAVVGQAVTFKVYVTAGDSLTTLVSGSVTLMDGDKVIGTADLVNGQASFTTSTLTVGSHTMTAKYAGNSSYSPALGMLTETINPLATPKVSISASANPATVGQPVTFKVSVAADPAGANAVSGSVTLMDGTAVIGKADLVNGQATITTSLLTVGSHTITANYGGNERFTPATGTMTEAIKSIVTGTISGQGSVLSGQDTLQLNVSAAMVNGMPAYSGSLTFADAKAGVTFTAASITSVQIFTQTPGGTNTSTNSYFVVTGTVTRNDGTALYSFTATDALPNPAEPNSRGSLSFQVKNANGAIYTLPFTAWDAGQTISITTDPPPPPA